MLRCLGEFLRRMRATRRESGEEEEEETEGRTGRGGESEEVETVAREETDSDADAPVIDSVTFPSLSPTAFRVSMGSLFGRGRENPQPSIPSSAVLRVLSLSNFPPKPPGLCKNGHRLEKFRTRHAYFTCDRCQRMQPAGAILYGCRTDNYDECPACRGVVAESPAEVARAHFRLGRRLDTVHVIGLGEARGDYVLYARNMDDATCQFWYAHLLTTGVNVNEARRRERVAASGKNLNKNLDGDGEPHDGNTREKEEARLAEEDLEGGKSLCTIEGYRVTHLAVSPNGNLVTAAAHVANAATKEVDTEEEEKKSPRSSNAVVLCFDVIYTRAISEVMSSPDSPVRLELREVIEMPYSTIVGMRLGGGRVRNARESTLDPHEAETDNEGIVLMTTCMDGGVSPPSSMNRDEEKDAIKLEIAFRRLTSVRVSEGEPVAKREFVLVRTFTSLEEIRAIFLAMREAEKARRGDRYYARTGHQYYADISMENDDDDGGEEEEEGDEEERSEEEEEDDDDDVDLFTTTLDVPPPIQLREEEEQEDEEVGRQRSTEITVTPASAPPTFRSIRELGRMLQSRVSERRRASSRLGIMHRQLFRVMRQYKRRLRAISLSASGAFAVLPTSSRRGELLIYDVRTETGAWFVDSVAPAWESECDIMRTFVADDGETVVVSAPANRSVTLTLVDGHVSILSLISSGASSRIVDVSRDGTIAVMLDRDSFSTMNVRRSTIVDRAPVPHPFMANPRLSARISPDSAFVTVLAEVDERAVATTGNKGAMRGGWATRFDLKHQHREQLLALLHFLAVRRIKTPKEVLFLVRDMLVER